MHLREASHPGFYGFLVKNWTFTEPGSSPGTAPYKYVVGKDVTDNPGVGGQDNPDPPGSFFSHVIVRYHDWFYDPSYGKGPFLSQAAWEEDSLAGFMRLADVGGVPVIVAKRNDPGVETVFDYP